MVMTDVLQASMPNPIDRAVVQYIQDRTQKLRDDYLTYESYYRGDQGAKLTDRIRATQPSGLVFSDNFCEVVVDVLAERLRVAGFVSDQDEVAALAESVWRRNRLDQSQNVVHTQAVMKGDAYVLVDWDAVAQRPRVRAQAPEMIIPHRDPATGDLTFVSKMFTWQPALGVQPVTRLSLYYPDRVEKYRGNGGAWVPILDQGERVWPTPWVDKRGRPLGIAVVPFLNRPASDDYGTSELVAVIPMQDLLNKTLIDLMQTADNMGFPQRWTKNTTPPEDGWEVVPGSIWNLFGEVGADVGVGQFEAADLSQLISMIEMLVQHVAGRSRTPQHLFRVTGQLPSGEALKAAEAGLVEKVKVRQVGFGNSWEDVMRLAAKLQELFGSEGAVVTDDTHIATLWDDPETRNEKSHLEVLAIKREKLGVPQEQVWRELNYTQDEIARMKEDIEAERVAETNIGAAILRNFNNGGRLAAS